VSQRRLLNVIFQLIAVLCGVWGQRAGVLPPETETFRCVGTGRLSVGASNRFAGYNPHVAICTHHKVKNEKMIRKKALYVDLRVDEKVTGLALRKRFFLCVIFKSTISPGAAFSTNTTLPFTWAMHLPSAAMDSMRTFQKFGSSRRLIGYRHNCQ
jgi:hypothetical protein